MRLRVRHPGVLLAKGLALIVLALPLFGQLTPELQDLAARCAAPGGAALPECRAALAAVEQRQDEQDAGAQPATQPVKPRASREEETKVGAESRPLPPAEESEFQRVVASSYGRLLPVFGMELFENEAPTFAPVDQVPVTADYAIGPGDEILLRTWGQVTLNLSLTVDREGSVYIPQAGNVRVAGLSYGELAGHLHNELSRVYRNFELSVNMGQLRSIQVFVVGAARRPGTYTVSSLSTLVNVLFASGGPTTLGSMRRVQLKRGSAVAAEFDLYDLVRKGDKSGDVRLLPGDVIFFPLAGPQVAVAGSVRHEGVFELKGESTLAELLQLAGGLSSVADGQNAILERIHDRAGRETKQIALDARGLLEPARDGDLLMVRAITPRFRDTVTLRGNVRNPGRVPWRPGMKLRDLIPDKDSLIAPGYWKRRNAQGFPPPAEAFAPDPPSQVEEDEDRPSERTLLQRGGEDINWSYAVIERKDPGDLSSRLLSFDLGRLVLEGDESQNLELRADDIVTVFALKDIRVPTSQQTRRIWLEGEFKAAGVYDAKPGETLGQLIERVGGLTPEAYLYASVLRRESTRQDQQRRLERLSAEMERELDQFSAVKLNAAVGPEEAGLLTARLESQRRLLQGMKELPAEGRIVLTLTPGSNDIAQLATIPLENGDRFLVPSQPNTVNVFGSVFNAGTFLHRQDLRIADYLQQAGGPTRTADKGKIFVIRADGSVTPKQGTGGLFKKAFEAGSLNPGDTVVVPEQLPGTPFLKGLRDWTQVFAQLALGAAAVNVLR